MRTLFLNFASGESLYLGAVLLLLTAATSPDLTHGWLLRLRNIGAFLALSMIVMACPPFACAVDVIFVTAFLMWFVAWNHTSQRRMWTRLRFATRAVLVLLLLALPAVEFSHRRMPAIRGQATDHVVVIGDSISSGLDARVPPWPAVMQQMTGVEVKNLARPGATMTDGVAMADAVAPEDRLILIEIGGNDLLAGTPSEAFDRELEAIVAKLAQPGRMVVMFELPLLRIRSRMDRSSGGSQRSTEFR